MRTTPANLKIQLKPSMSEIRNYLVANPIELSHTGMNNNPFDSIIF